MPDYSELLLDLNRTLQEIHKATLAKNFEVAEQYTANFVRTAHTLQHTFTEMISEDRE